MSARRKIGSDQFEWQQREQGCVLMVGEKLIYKCQQYESFKHTDVVVSNTGAKIAIRVDGISKAPSQGLASVSILGTRGFASIRFFSKSPSAGWKEEAQIISRSAFGDKVFNITELAAVSDDGRHLLMRVGERVKMADSEIVQYFWQTWDIFNMRVVKEGLCIDIPPGK